jgi:hypothetical protein
VVVQRLIYLKRTFNKITSLDQLNGVWLEKIWYRPPIPKSHSTRVMGTPGIGLGLG